MDYWTTVCLQHCSLCNLPLLIPHLNVLTNLLFVSIPLCSYLSSTSVIGSRKSPLKLPCTVHCHWCSLSEIKRDLTLGVHTWLCVLVYGHPVSTAWRCRASYSLESIYDIDLISCGKDAHQHLVVANNTKVEAMLGWDCSLCVIGN